MRVGVLLIASASGCQLVSGHAELSVTEPVPDAAELPDVAASEVSEVVPDADVDGMLDAAEAELPPISCRDLKARRPTAPSGAYELRDQTRAYCEMTADGGGWTLILKIDGAKPTFTFDSQIWTNDLSLESSHDLSLVEYKNRAFSTLAFDAVRLAMVESGRTRAIVVPTKAPSLKSLFLGGAVLTSLGQATWFELLSSARLQGPCYREGFNLRAPTYPDTRVRIGIVGDSDSDCLSPDSFLGFGTEIHPMVCGESEPREISCGNYAGGGCAGVGSSNDRRTKAFGFVFVR